MNFPISERREAMTIIAAMIGTAANPLITALQNNALIGSSGDQMMLMPSSVANPMTP